MLDRQLMVGGGVLEWEARSFTGEQAETAPRD